MPERLRLSLLVLVVGAAVAARAGGALGAPVRLTQSARVGAEQARIAGYARRFVGVRYSYGGTTPSSGFDCSGFTRWVYAHFGIDLPHYSVAQYDLGRRVARDALEPGDLVFFDGLGHVGLYIGDGKFIHAPHSGLRVSIETLAHHGSYVGARRIV